MEGHVKNGSKMNIRSKCVYTCYCKELLSLLMPPPEFWTASSVFDYLNGQYFWSSSVYLCSGYQKNYKSS